MALLEVSLPQTKPNSNVKIPISIICIVNCIPYPPLIASISNIGAETIWPQFCVRYLKYTFYENVIWLKLHWNFSLGSNEQYAFICPARLDELQMFFHLSLQIRFPLKCHCKEIYHFMNAHTLASLISWVYKHNLFVSIYILRKSKCIHTPDNAHLFYIIAFHAYLYFSALTK